MTAQDRKVIKWSLDARSTEKVRVDRLKRQFWFLRAFSDSLIEDRLHEADLAWLRRPGKSIVATIYLQERIGYCRAVKRKQVSTLQKWWYTDGIVFYLDRTEDESESSQRAAFGTRVWRRSDNRDAMIQDCIGFSSYNKGQGVPVRVWGQHDSVHDVVTRPPFKILEADMHHRLRGAGFLSSDFLKSIIYNFKDKIFMYVF